MASTSLDIRVYASRRRLDKDVLNMEVTNCAGAKNIHIRFQDPFSDIL